MKCLVCNEEKAFHIERYPRMICNVCNELDYFDEQGNKVEFFNEDIYGGFFSSHKINGNTIIKREHICYIQNIRCYADEGRFGDIIIQVL